jgi:ERCC4-type nuclease
MIIIITIDSREPQSEIWEIISDLDIEIPEFKFACIPKGDYLLEAGYSSLLIERKEIHDFTGSFVDLKERMDEMRSKYERTALLLEGSYTVQDGMIMLWLGNVLVPSMNHKSFTNFIASQQARGSYFYRTNNLEETIRQLIFLHEYLEIMGKRPIRKVRSATEWLLMLPGMGIKTLNQAREDYEYDTPFDLLCNSEISRWCPPKTRRMLEDW